MFLRKQAVKVEKVEKPMFSRSSQKFRRLWDGHRYRIRNRRFNCKSLQKSLIPRKIPKKWEEDD